MRRHGSPEELYQAIISYFSQIGCYQGGNDRNINAINNLIITRQMDVEHPPVYGATEAERFIVL